MTVYSGVKLSSLSPMRALCESEQAARCGQMPGGEARAAKRKTCRADATSVAASLNLRVGIPYGLSQQVMGKAPVEPPFVVLDYVQSLA